MTFENKTIEFKPLGILTHDMIEEVYEYPHRLMNINYFDYGDGIICGLDYVVRNYDIFLTRGIIKLNNKFFFLNDDLNLTQLTEPYRNQNKSKEYHIGLVKIDDEFIGGVNVERLEIKISQENYIFDLGKFYNDLTMFQLPTFKSNLIEEFTRRSNLNLINVNYSIRGGNTFHPRIFNLIKEFLIVKKNKNFYDYPLIVELEHHSVISRDMIKSYIAESGERLINDSNEGLLRSFIKALKVEIKMPTMIAEQKSIIDDDDDDEDDPILI